MPITDITEQLDRSRVSLDPVIRDILTQGRTVRSRNRDGEYAIVLTDDRAVVDTKHGERLGGIADDRAEWTITVTDFTFKNVADAEANGEPSLYFWAPVFDRDGVRVGTIAVNADTHGTRRTDQGRRRTRVTPFMFLLEGDLFTEAEQNEQGEAVVFRATADAGRGGHVEAVVEATGESRTFDLGSDYLVFQLA
jgi:hypothetical protein